jgi:alkylation response protein AidB-like acyl-CoA dehydrogenase
MPRFITGGFEWGDMVFEPTQEQQLIRRTARELAEAEFADHPFPDPAEGYPWGFARTLAEHDLLGIRLPREYGGEGMSALDTVVAMQGVGEVSPVAASTIHMASFGPAQAIAEYGDEALRERYLPDVAAGESIVAIGMSEPEAGSHATAMTTEAEDDGDAWVINGQKAWVSEAPHADAFLVYVRMPDGHIGSVIVDEDTPGFAVADPDRNMADQPQSELFFDDARVPKANTLLTGPDAFRKQITAYNIERVGSAAKVWIAARWALREALEYSKEREQFGQPIGEFQAVEHRLAEMATKVTNMRYQIFDALAADELPSRLESSMAKVYVTEAGQEVVDDALQIKGAAGYVGDTPESFLFRYVRGYRIASGTSDVHRTMIARSLRESGLPD